MHLVRGLAKADGQNSYFVYGPRDILPESNEHRNFTVHEPGSLAYPFWEQGLLPLWAQRDHLDVLHCPANTAPLCLPRETKLVLSVHDVMYLLPPSILPPSRVLRQRMGNLYRRIVVPWVVHRANRIITVSEFSKAEIVGRLGVNPDIIRVTYEGVEKPLPASVNTMATPRSFQGHKLGGRFILALGAADPRKNTKSIIRVYADLRRSQAIEEKLVILGLQRWQSSSFYKLAFELGVIEDVFFADYVTEEELGWFYRSARCLLYPTLYEGFGFPCLEAMAFGTPVITSNVSAIPEVVGDAALLIDPRSCESIREALLRLLRDENLRRTLIGRGRARVANFSWESAVERTLSVYSELGDT